MEQTNGTDMAFKQRLRAREMFDHDFMKFVQTPIRVTLLVESRACSFCLRHSLHTSLLLAISYRSLNPTRTYAPEPSISFSRLPHLERVMCTVPHSLLLPL
jgi:hypothetical protein